MSKLPEIIRALDDLTRDEISELAIVVGARANPHSCAVCGAGTNHEGAQHVRTDGGAVVPLCASHVMAVRTLDLAPKHRGLFTPHRRPGGLFLRNLHVGPRSVFWTLAVDHRAARRGC